jgi:hypothetical protein
MQRCRPNALCKLNNNWSGCPKFDQLKWLPSQISGKSRHFGNANLVQVLQREYWASFRSFIEKLAVIRRLLIG